MLINIKYNGKDDMPYIMENKKTVWNHRPEWKVIKAMFQTTNQIISLYNFDSLKNGCLKGLATETYENSAFSRSPYMSYKVGPPR